MQEQGARRVSFAAPTRIGLVCSPLRPGVVRDVAGIRPAGLAFARAELSDRRALRAARRLRERRGAVREERRPSDDSGRDRQAADRGDRVPRAQGRAPASRRQVRGFRTRLAHRRRALARAGDVSRHPQRSAHRRPVARPCHSGRQRRGDHARGGHFRNGGKFRRSDEQARRRTRHDAFDLRQCAGDRRPEATRDRARHGAARRPHHSRLPRLLPLLRREGLHLEQDPPAQPRSAADDGRRRRRPDGGGLRRERLRPRSVRRRRTASG